MFQPFITTIKQPTTVRDYKYQVAVISYTGGATGIKTEDISLDTAYNKCVGVSAAIISNAGNATFDIGIGTRDKNHIEPINSSFLVPQNTNPNDQFMDVSIDITSKGARVTTNLTSALANTLTYQVVFKLVKE